MANRPARQSRASSPILPRKQTAMVEPASTGTPEAADATMTGSDVDAASSGQTDDTDGATGHTETDGTPEAENFSGVNVATPNGRILEPGAPVVFDGTPVTGGAVIANEDVYRRVVLAHSSRHTFVLVVRKGTRVVRGSLTPKTPGNAF